MPSFQIIWENYPSTTKLEDAPTKINFTMLEFMQELSYIQKFHQTNKTLILL